MDTKTEEQIAKEREAVEAMRNAKANMTASLDRISTLEAALRAAVQGLKQAKGFVGGGAYIYPNDRRVSCHDAIEQSITAAQKSLGT